MYAKYFASVLAIIAALAGVGFAQAETIIAENFESYATGNLNNGTNANPAGTWVEYVSAYKSPVVVVDPLNGLNKVVASSTSTTDREFGAKIVWATPIKFTTSDIVEVSYKVLLKKGGTGTYARVNVMNTYMSLMFDPTAWKGAVGTYARTDDYNMTPKNVALNAAAATPANPYNFYYGAVVPNDQWYDVKAVLDFSWVGAGNNRVGVTFYNRQSGATEWIKDSTMSPDANLVLTPNAEGEFISNAFCLYIRTNNTSYPQYGFVDDINITRVPEPGTLALLGCGLMGLLCYAWRKRK